MTREIKALLLMQAKNEVSDGFYPTVSSHGDRHLELEAKVKERYAELVDSCEWAFEELIYVEG